LLSFIRIIIERNTATKKYTQLHKSALNNHIISRNFGWSKITTDQSPAIIGSWTAS